MADGILATSIKTDKILQAFGSRADFQSKSFISFFKVIPFRCNCEIDVALADAAGAGAAMEVAVTATIPGAALGDFVFITAANVITIQLQNLTGGDLTTYAAAGGEILNGFILRIRPEILNQLSIPGT
jgi:hypothetical protein